MTQWACSPSFNYTASTTLAIYFTQKVQPHFVLYFHSGPIPPHFLAQWVYTPSFSYTVGSTLAIYCSQTVQPYFLPYLYSGPIPPHFRTQWHAPPHLLTQGAPPKLSTVHRLSSFISSLLEQWANTSSFYDTVGLYPVIYLHSGHHPGHLLYTDCPASLTPLLAQWAHTSSFYDTVYLYPLIYLHSAAVFLPHSP